MSYAKRKQQISLAALAAGYELEWAADDSLCWLQDTYDGRVNTDDAWAPDRLLSDAASLAMALEVSTDVKGSATAHSEVMVSRELAFGSTLKASVRIEGPSTEKRIDAYIAAVFAVAVKYGEIKYATALAAGTQLADQTVFTLPDDKFEEFGAALAANPLSENKRARVLLNRPNRFTN